MLIKEIIKSDFAISHEKGQIVYDITLKELSKNDEIIELDFEGIKATISTFFNTSYGLLYKDFDEDTIDKRIKFENLTPISQMQIDAVRENAITFFKKENS